MDLYLYKNLLDKRYLYKDVGLTQLGRVSAELKNDTSYINPTFIVSYSPLWKWCNYIYSSDLERYYYVTDVEASQNRLMIKCHVDVLMSYKEAIKEKMILVKRSSTKGNYYLDDEKFKAYAMPNKRVLPFGKPSIRGFYDSTTNSQFLLGIVGRNPDAPEENEGN